MAGVHTYKQLGRDVTIYAIDHSVGVYGRNRMDDVQLIQIMINAYIDRKEEAYKDHPANDARVVDDSGRTIDKLVVDGNCGSRTLAAIVATQKSLNKWKGCAVDGQIDAIDEGGLSQYNTRDLLGYAEERRGLAVVKKPVYNSQFNTMYVLAVATGAQPDRSDWDRFDLPEPLRSTLMRSIAESAARRARAAERASART